MNFPERWLLPALLGLTAILTIGTSGWGDLYNETDGQYGAAAKVMAEGGSWLIPENDGIPRLVKPPLLYWTMAASMKIFGVNEFSARLPGAVAITLWVAVTFLIGAKMGGPWRGFLAGAILLGSLGTFTLGRIVMPEPLFSAFVAGALYCVLRGHEEVARREKWFWGFWLCAALASFTKGWHGLIYPLAIVGLTWLFCTGSRRHLRGLISWQGVLIFCAINLPWYFYIESKFPGWLQNLTFSEQLGHVTGSSAPATDYTVVPRWQFLLLHVAWFFPWSLVAITLLLTGGKDAARSLRRLPASFGAMLVLSWGTVILASVLLAGQRQDYYAMSLWPAFALAVAALMDGRSLRPSAVFLTLLLCIGFLFAVSIPSFASDGGTASVAERATAWTTVTQFDGTVWHSLRTTALLTLGGSAVCCLLASLVRGRRQVLALVAATAFLALGAVSGTSLVAPYFSLAQAAPSISREATAATRLIYDGGLDTGSSLLFYTSLPVTFLNQNPDEDFIVRKFGIGRHLFLTTEELISLWKSGTRVILVTESARLPEWQTRLNTPLVPFSRCGTQVVLKN